MRNRVENIFKSVTDDDYIHIHNLKLAMRKIIIRNKESFAQKRIEEKLSWCNCRCHSVFEQFSWLEKSREVTTNRKRNEGFWEVAKKAEKNRRKAEHRMSWQGARKYLCQYDNLRGGREARWPSKERETGQRISRDQRGRFERRGRMESECVSVEDH